MMFCQAANIAIVYLNEHRDAEETKDYIEKMGGRVILISGDLGDEAFSNEVVKKTKDAFGSIDILVNNAGEQRPQKSIEQITSHQLLRTFQTNIFAMFYLTKAVLPHLSGKWGSAWTDLDNPPLRKRKCLNLAEMSQCSVLVSQ